MSHNFLLMLLAGFCAMFLFTQCSSGPAGEITKEPFGKTTDGEEADLYTLSIKNGISAKITTYGGTVISLMVPDKNGKMEDIVLGYDSLDKYIADRSYFGCLVGRYGNRIAKGKFTIDGKEYSLFINNGPNTLHGGKKGFDKVIWKAEEIKCSKCVGLKLTYVSKDMEEGYPGTLTSVVQYKLTKDNELKIEYEAETDKPTHVNLTHHSYFNLSAGKENILNHELKIDADKYTVVDKDLIPTGESRDVTGPMDFRIFKAIGKEIAQVEDGYDHNYVLNNKSGKLVLIGELYEEKSGRLMEISTTEPGVQFYSGNFLDGSMTGKGGIKYTKNYGLCLETQHFPDTPNQKQPDFPSTLLKPGKKYTHTTIYKFKTK